MLRRRRFVEWLGAAACRAAVLPATVRAATGPRERAMLSNANTISLFLCGDVMTGRGIDQILPHPGDPAICERFMASALGYVNLAEQVSGSVPKPVGFSYIWGDALAELERRAPDARIVNLETSVTTSDDCTDKGISYRMNPANIPCLIALGIDCCVLANNHVLDWGRGGLLETLDSLQRAGLKVAGAGRDSAAAAAPAVLEIPGKGRLLIFAFGLESSGIPSDWAATAAWPGVNLLPDLSADRITGIASRVRQVKQPGDVVIASLHWGGNWGYSIPREHREFAHGLIDEAGVDIVHGHSSHHAKGIEVYGERPIFYGCGDFLNDYEGIGGYESFRSELVLMYFLHIGLPSGTLQRCQMVPLRLRRLCLNRASTEEAQWLARTLSREGRSFGTSVLFQDKSRLELSWQ